MYSVIRKAVTEVLCCVQPGGIQGMNLLAQAIDRISQTPVDKLVIKQMLEADRKGILSKICTGDYSHSNRQGQLVAARYAALDDWAEDLHSQEIG